MNTKQLVHAALGGYVQSGLIDKSTYHRLLEATEPQETDNKPGRMIKTPEVAKLLGCTTATVSNWTKKGLLKKYSVGGQYVRYDENEILAFLAANSK